MDTKHGYTALDGRIINISGLTAAQKSYLGEKILSDKARMNYMDFQNRYLEDPVVLGSPQLYDLCRDLATRLGISQGYLKKESYSHGAIKEEKELTSPDVAKMGLCSPQAVRDAIKAGRLSARRVGPLYLIKENNAEAFIASLRKNKSRVSPDSRKSESVDLQPLHAKSRRA
jgi:hypothetical protein